MAQVLFTSDTTPASADLDANFTELYGRAVATAGTYTPTLTNEANVAASTAYACQWMRVAGSANVIVVSGKIDIDPTSASTATAIGISLPVASALTGQQQLGGTAQRMNASVAPLGAFITADVTNDRATLQFFCDATVSNQAWSFIFQYQVA